MVTVMLWLNEHRIWVVAFIAACLWIGPYSFYFKGPLRAWWRRGKPHNWSVDLAAKRAISNGKEEVR